MLRLISRQLLSVVYSQPQEDQEADEEQLESVERKAHEADGQTGEQNVQSETAVELGGEASERDQAKEVGTPKGQRPTILHTHSHTSVSYRNMGVEPPMPANQRATSPNSQPGWPHSDRPRNTLRFEEITMTPRIRLELCWL